MESATVSPEVADKAFEFAQGIYGFPSVRRFLVAEIPGGGDLVKQLVAIDQGDLSFTLVYPFAFFPDYAPEIPMEELQELGADGLDQVIAMVIANVPAKFSDATANLKAPLIFNPHTRKARQIILTDDRYATRHRLFPAE